MEPEIDVPSFFLCPISLQIMKDPVTVPTGITYDRDSIERWLSSSSAATCPVTKQPIPPDADLTPNIILRRLIQSWCTLNASHGFERIPTPKPPVTKAQISKLIHSAATSSSPHYDQVKCLRQLRSLAKESEANRRCIEQAPGAVDFLASVVVDFNHDTELDDEALSLLHGLQISEPALKALVNRNCEFINSLTRVMQRGTYESRAYAVLISRSAFRLADPLRIIGVRVGFLAEVVQMVRDRVSRQATKAALGLLVELGPWGRNRVKAVESGAVPALVDLLLDSPSESESRRACELALAALDVLCQCAEGRAELLKHAAGLAVVSKKILRVSTAATEKAVRILLSVGKSSATAAVLQEMLQIGVVAKLCLVLQVESSARAKDKAREILRLHARVWRSSPCVPATLLCSYPAAA
ncbi:unnamed protein product [Linum tenue]|uniref:U-box domain-containing protein n=2 Tax=Linum tenue TaxID=586396 RepID=A0AAV0I1N9_9ROSI|nr:unnamed protein product [Linum tenue]